MTLTNPFRSTNARHTVLVVAAALAVTTAVLVATSPVLDAEAAPERVTAQRQPLVEPEVHTAPAAATGEAIVAAATPVSDAERYSRYIASLVRAEAERAAAERAEAERLAAEQAAQTAAAARARTSSSSMGGGWAALRRCESGGNYSAVSSSGTYRGAYQFSRSTWNSVAARSAPHLVGVDPAAASPADQDAMALALYRSSGSRPWPHCGRHL